MPSDNGTLACADARKFVQDIDADIARFNRLLATAQARERQAEAALAAAKRKPNASLRQAELAVTAAQGEVTRVQGEGKRLDRNAHQAAVTAVAQCMTAPPTASQTKTQHAVPADNGTKECGSDRNQMISLLHSIEHLKENEAFRDLGPLGLSAPARNQIETQVGRLTAQLDALATKAAAACASFSGTWHGTYTQSSSEGCPGKTGPTTLTLTQTGSSLSGTIIDVGYNLCPDVVDLHGTMTGTVTGNTADIQSAYDNNAGTYAGTLTLTGGKVIFKEESGDSAIFTRG